MLTPGMRAVAIKVQEVSGVGGFIMPGDRVDVIVSLKWKVDQDDRKSGAPFTEYTSETIVQNARVMGIDQAYNDFEENVVKASAITLEVTPKQAEIIAIAENRGSLSLALRSLVPGPIGVIRGFNSDRETLYSLGAGFPAADRLAQPIIVAGTAGDDGASTGIQQVPGVQIFRAMTARRDLPRGTLMRESDVDWAALPAGLRPEDYVIQGREATTPAFLTGVLLNADIKAGEPLKATDLFSGDNAEFLGLALRPGMRAASLQNLANVFAGTPGDRVDVVLTGEVEGRLFSETILQRARPGLKDIPILGALFRSSSFQKKETELVISVTPYLIRPINQSDVTLPTDGFAPASDFDRYLLGRLHKVYSKNTPSVLLGDPNGLLDPVGYIME